jgi:hypothetical protein
MNIKNVGSFLIRKSFNHQLLRCPVDIIAAAIFEVRVLIYVYTLVILRSSEVWFKGYGVIAPGICC